jgi:Ca2+-binding RTX toxin-like protein
MATVVADLRTQVEAFFDSVNTTALESALGSDLPLVGAALQEVLPEELPLFSALEQEILSVLDGLEEASSPEAIASALDDLDGVEASASGDTVLIGLNATDNFAPAPGEFDLSIGAPSLGVVAAGGASFSLGYALDVDLSLDTSGDASETHELSTLAGGGDDLTLTIEGSLDVDGEGELGFLGVGLSDELDTPELAITAAIDIADGVNVLDLALDDISTLIDGSADLRLALQTLLPSDLLPTLFTDLVVSYDIENFDPTEGLSGLGAIPSITLEGIELDLGSFVDFLAGVFGPIMDDVFGSFPLGPLLDTVTTPLPIIDDATDALGLTSIFDLVANDDNITLLDLAVAGGADRDVLNAFALAFNFINAMTEAEGAGEVDRVQLGSITLLGDAPGPMSLLAGPPVFQPPSGNPLEDAANGLGDTLGGTPDPVGGLGGILQPLVDVLDSAGVTIPFLENPETLIPVLLNGLGGGDAVTLIEYDVPELSYTASYNQFFPILGPLGISFGGEFSTLIDINFGYDTRGIAEGAGFERGFYFNTDQLDAPILVGDEFAYYEPAGTVGAGINAAAAVNVGIAEIAVGGGLLAGLAAYFPSADTDGKLRLADVVHCLFDPITGEFGAEVFVRFTVGFGPFSFTRKIDIADVTLATFMFGCPPPQTDPEMGLATLGPDQGLPGGVLALNAGTRAGLRAINGRVGVDGEESFQVRNARTEDGQLIKGALVVSAFTLDEQFGDAAAGNPATSITAQMGNARDTVVIAADVLQDAHLEGGAGDDLIVGGAGADELFGQGDSDHLIGGAGSDRLEGGDSDDLLEGGLGADILEGGAGTDQVTYENSASAVTFTFTSVDGRAAFVGSGGEATGDVLYDIEYLIGSHFSDQFYGNPGQSNTIEGLAGNDVIVGGVAGDFLLGGGGADALIGNAGVDATSYVTSNGLVYVNLATGVGLFSDAAGDYLSSIENVQGSFAGDFLIGSSGNNLLDGWYGDDRLEGAGGQDEVRGGGGFDIVHGGADGDTLDGGGAIGSLERDLLTYERLASGVTVNLLDGSGDDTTVRGVLANGTVLNAFSTFEDLTGSQQGDSLTGDTGYNVIRGLGGNDAIAGAGGDDTIIGGAGADAMDGGDGIDFADYLTSPGSVLVTLAGGFGALNDAAGDTLVNIENVRGSDFLDELYGSDANNWIDPALGRSATPETVNGFGGDDTLVLDYSRGDTGLGLTGGYSNLTPVADGSFQRLAADGLTVLDAVSLTSVEKLRIVGTARADTIYGGLSHDLISTGSGDDTVYTGLGFDRVFAGGGDDTVYAGTSYSRSFSPVGGSTAVELVGGYGIDTLSVSLASFNGPVTLTGTDGTSEYTGINAALLNGTGIREFEVLGDVLTGRGDDTITQPGVFDNSFDTGFGVDVIRPGLGVDEIDGGLEFRVGTEIGEPPSAGYGTLAIEGGLQNLRTVLQNDGDLLVLDYSSVDEGVIGVVDVEYTRYDMPVGFLPSGAFELEGVYTNSGTYEAGENAVSFTNIERLSVTGSASADYIEGTYLLLGINGNSLDDNPVIAASASLRGDDSLFGGDGDDIIIGQTGDDTINGGAGDDIIIGSAPFGDGRIFDLGELDRLTGGAGGDTFVLGSSGDGTLYSDFLFVPGIGTIEDYGLVSNPNRAIITDFNLGEDTLALYGDEEVDASFYRAEEIGGSTFIYWADGFGFDSERVPANDELIAELVGVTGFDLGGDYVEYITFPDELFLGEALTASPKAAAPDATLAAAAEAGDVTTLSHDWVSQTNDVATLRSALFGSSFSPVGQGVLTIEGNASAFGTFEDDPFGLGSGVVLSTGDVEQLAGVNTEDGGLSLGQSIDVPFTAIASFPDNGTTFGGSTVYRADLSALGIDLNSIVLGDRSGGFGGGGGLVSGFDIDALVLSSTRLDGLANLTDFNNGALLPRLDVFGFNAAEAQFYPGTQRPGSTAYPNSPDLFGSVNGLPDFATATLNTVDASGYGGPGMLSLGDTGSVGFDLRETVSAEGPLYLYVVESGDTLAEQLQTGLTASTNRLNSPTDLSTDLGLPGEEGDTVSMTYRFTPTDADGNIDATVTEVAFDFVFFSEELVEYAQSEFNDDFKIELNGINLARLSDGSYASVNTLYAPAAGPEAKSSIYELLTEDVESDLIYNPVGSGPSADETRADGYSKVLRFTAPINPGVENVLTIQARDVRDGLLDSGILIRGGSLTGNAAAIGFIIDRNDASLGEGDSRTVNFGLTLAPGGTLDEAVTVSLDPTAGLDLGAGAGAAVTYTFNPGGSFTDSFVINALNDGVDAASRPESVAVNVTGGGLGGVAPLVLTVTDGDATPKPQNPVEGTPDDDHLPGTPGDDCMFGYEGDDVLCSSPGADKMDGGAGCDTVDYSREGRGAIIFLEQVDKHGISGKYAGTAAGGQGSAAGDTYVSTEKVIATNSADLVYGTSSGTIAYLGRDTDVFDNRHTSAGVDKVYGEKGHDWIYTGGGHDLLDGGRGDDHLFGEAGDDILSGGKGNDVLEGGAGADIFRYRSPGDGYDVIKDFEVGVDKVDLQDTVPIAAILDSQTLTSEGDLILYYARLGHNVAITFEDVGTLLTASDFI